MVDGPPNPVDPTQQVSDASERARFVADFLRDQATREEHSRHSEILRARMRRVRRFVVAVAWVGVTYTWVATPAWLTVEPVVPQTVVEESESLRVDMWLQAQRIEAYRQQRGRLPYVLDEAGPRFRGIEYRRRDNRVYEIIGRSDRVELEFDSRTPADEFLGPAGRLLADPAGPDGDGP